VSIGFLLRMAYLTARPVWYDEVITIFYAQSSFSYILKHFVHGSNPPFAYFFYRIWILCFGTSQLSFEIVSVLFSVLALFMMNRVGRLLFDAWTGVIAVCLLAFSSYHLFVSQQIRGYSMACFFALVSIDQLFRFTKKGERRFLIGWILSCFFMIGTHFYTVFLFAVECLVILVAWQKESKTLKMSQWLIYAAGSLLILFASWIFLHVVQAAGFFPFYARPVAGFSDVQLVLQSVFFLSKPLVGLSIMLVSASGAWILKNQKQAANQLYFLAAWFLVSVGVPLLISSAIPSFFYVRYYIFTHLAWVLLTAFAIRLIPMKLVRMTVVFVFIFYLSFLISDYFGECRAKQAQKEIFQNVTREFQAGDVIVHENGWTFGPSYYYHQGKLNEFFLTDEFVVPTLEEHQMAPQEIGRYQRFWLFLETPDDMLKLARENWFQKLNKKLVKSDRAGAWYLFKITK